MKDRIIREGKACSYCNNVSPLIKETKFGKIVECPICFARVSYSKYTGWAKGSLANAELRQQRRIAHYHSEILIKRKMAKNNVNQSKAKELLYHWLSEQIKLDFVMDSIAELFIDETVKIIDIMKTLTKK
jgi:uncharacterized Zn finger protein (UPF0148 family)